MIGSAIDYDVPGGDAVILNPLQFRPLLVLRPVGGFSEEIAQKKSNMLTGEFTLNNFRPESELLITMNNAVTDSADRPFPLLLWFAHLIHLQANSNWPQAPSTRSSSLSKILASPCSL